MRVFNISPHDDVQRFDMDVDLQVGVLRNLGRGQAHEGPWTPIPVQRLKKPRKRREESLCDLSAVAANVSVPVMSARARQVLEPILGADAQWLRLVFDEGEYWLLNLLRVVDAVDPTMAAVRRFPDGRVADIEEYAFVAEVVAREWLFKVSTATFDVLATDRLRELVLDHALTGFHFQPVWDSGHKPFRVFPGRDHIRSRPEVFGPDGFVANYSEFWPAEWKELARQRKREARPAAKRAS